jgi:hypothetical protein
MLIFREAAALMFKGYAGRQQGSLLTPRNGIMG